MGYNPAFDQEGLQKLNKMYDEGYKMKDLAKIFNVHYCTIQKYIWKPRHKGPFKGSKKTTVCKVTSQKCSECTYSCGSKG